MKMKTLNRLTKEQLKTMIEKDPALQRDLRELGPYYKKGQIDHGFGQGNFFTKTGLFNKRKIVIQWLDDYNLSYETVVDSLEECVVRLKEIEDCDGLVDVEKSNIKINTFQLGF